MSTTPYFSLALPATGTTNWGTSVNANFTAIDAELHALATGGATGPTGPTGPTGAVGMIFAGQWNGTTSYVVTDSVTFNGAFYIAIANNSGSQPDTNPSSWTLLAAAGAAGPAGPIGPAGPSGPQGSQGAPGSTGATGPQGPSGITSFPILVSQGGTGSTTAPGARTNLGAAASGANSDITSLNALAATSTQVGLTITGLATATAISWNDGVSGQAGGITVGGNAFLESIQCAGGILAGNLQASGALLVGLITAAVPNSTIVLGSAGGSVCVVEVNNGLIVAGNAPTAAAGQIGIGSQTAASFTPSGAALGGLLLNIAGTSVKIPYYTP